MKTFGCNGGGNHPLHLFTLQPPLTPASFHPPVRVMGKYKVSDAKVRDWG